MPPRFRRTEMTGRSDVHTEKVITTFPTHRGLDCGSEHRVRSERLDCGVVVLAPGRLKCPLDNVLHR